MPKSALQELFFDSLRAKGKECPKLYIGDLVYVKNNEKFSFPGGFCVIKAYLNVNFKWVYQIRPSKFNPKEDEKYEKFYEKYFDYSEFIVSSGPEID